MFKWLVNGMRGLILGIACVLPGVSGGVIALSMGLYQPILAALVHFRRDVKVNARFLAPLAVGGGIGILLTARAMSEIIQRAESNITVLFVGLVLGGLRALWAQATEGKAPRVNDKGAVMAAGWTYRQWVLNILLMLLGFGLIFVFSLLDRVTEPGAGLREFNGWLAVMGGAVYAFATVVPGVSSSFLLLYLGIYQPMMNALGHPLTQIKPLLFALAGGLACAAILIKVVEWLFRRFPAPSRFTVMGFVLGSVYIVFPWPVFAANWLTHTLLLIAGIVVALLFERAFAHGDRDTIKEAVS
ncbi:MAG: DUF368 domain-containing protein [Oscillospiraceae bacterium]|jgi:putative membrane protein|nr:DUF368 domain-containing protein [Oscillospiraceae bacterium]